MTATDGSVDPAAAQAPDQQPAVENVQADAKPEASATSETASRPPENRRAKKSPQVVDEMYRTWIRLGKNAKATARVMRISESTVRGWRDREEWVRRSLGMPERDYAAERARAQEDRAREVAKARSDEEEADPELWALYRLTRKMAVNRLKQWAGIKLGDQVTPELVKKFEKKALQVSEADMPRAIKVLAETRRVLDGIRRENDREKREVEKPEARPEATKFEGDVKVTFHGDQVPTVKDIFLALKEAEAAKSGRN